MRRRIGPSLVILTALLFAGGSLASDDDRKPDACSQLRPGDIQIESFNSQDPDEINFLATNNLASSVGSIYVTLDSWNDDLQEFEGPRGTLRFVIPTITFDTYEMRRGNRVRCDGICARGKFFYSALSATLDPEFAMERNTASGFRRVGNPPFQLNETSGESLLVYCRTNTSASEVHFVYGVTFATNLLDAETFFEQAPKQLRQNADISLLRLPYMQSYEYQGPTRFQTADELKAAMVDASYWEGSNQSRQSKEIQESIESGLYWLGLLVLIIPLGFAAYFYHQKRNGADIEGQKNNLDRICLGVTGVLLVAETLIFLLLF